eukprot:GHVS01088797.1.p1 GENE.GHVS01088797.1~~GHVS01088797.1.p1  ORF type:complete len:1279 (+),score=150.57 GHVS01088797.1:274-4110(+)
MPATENSVTFKAVISLNAIDEPISAPLPTRSSTDEAVQSSEVGRTEQHGATASRSGTSCGGTQVKMLTDVPVPDSIAELLQMLVGADVAKTCLKCGCIDCLSQGGKSEDWWVMPPTRSLQKLLSLKRGGGDDGLGREEKEEVPFDHNRGDCTLQKSESGDETEEEYICLTTTHTSITDQKRKTSLNMLRQPNPPDCQRSGGIYRIVGRSDSRRVQIHVDCQLVQFLTSSQKRLGLGGIGCASLRSEGAECDMLVNEFQVEKRHDDTPILEGYEVLEDGYSCFGVPTLFVYLQCSKRVLAGLRSQTCTDVTSRHSEWTDVIGSGTTDRPERECLVDTPETVQPFDDIKCFDVSELDFELLNCPIESEAQAVVTTNTTETDAVEVALPTGIVRGDRVAAKHYSQLRTARGNTRRRNRRSRGQPSRRIHGGAGKACHGSAMGVDLRRDVMRGLGFWRPRRMKNGKASGSGRKYHAVSRARKVGRRTGLGPRCTRAVLEGGSSLKRSSSVSVGPQYAVACPVGQSVSSTRVSSRDYCITGGLLLGGPLAGSPPPRTQAHSPASRSISDLDGSWTLSLWTPPLMISQRLLMYQRSEQVSPAAATVRRRLDMTSLTQAASRLLMSSLPDVPMEPRGRPAVAAQFQSSDVKPVVVCEGVGFVPFPAPLQPFRRRSSWTGSAESSSLMFANPLVPSSEELYSTPRETDFQHQQRSEGILGKRLARDDSKAGAAGVFSEVCGLQGEGSSVRCPTENSPVMPVDRFSTSSGNNVPVTVHSGSDESGSTRKRMYGWSYGTSAVPIHTFNVEGGPAAGSGSFDAVVRTTTTTTTTQTATFICGSHQRGTADSVSTCYVSTFIAGVPSDVVMSSSSLSRDADEQIYGTHLDGQVDARSSVVAAESRSVHSCSSGEPDVSADFPSPGIVQSAVLLPFFSVPTESFESNSGGTKGSSAGYTKRESDASQSPAGNKCVPFPSLMTGSMSSFLLCSNLSAPALELTLSTPNGEASKADTTNVSTSSAAETEDSLSRQDDVHQIFPKSYDSAGAPGAPLAATSTVTHDPRRRSVYSPALSMRHISALLRSQEISDVSHQSVRCPTAGVFTRKHGHSAQFANSNSDRSTTPPTRRLSEVDSLSSASSRSSSPSVCESAGPPTRPQSSPRSNLFFPPMLQRYSRKYYSSAVGQNHDSASSTKPPSAAAAWRNVLSGGSPGLSFRGAPKCFGSEGTYKTVDSSDSSTWNLAVPPENPSDDTGVEQLSSSFTKKPDTYLSDSVNTTTQPPMQKFSMWWRR